MSWHSGEWTLSIGSCPTAGATELPPSFPLTSAMCEVHPYHQISLKTLLPPPHPTRAESCPVLSVPTQVSPPPLCSSCACPGSDASAQDCCNKSKRPGMSSLQLLSSTLHPLQSNFCKIKLCSHQFPPNSTQNSSKAPTAYKVKRSILKTAFQVPPAPATMGTIPSASPTLFPLCPSHLWSSPEETFHSLLATPAQTRHTAFTHPVFSASSPFSLISSHPFPIHSLRPK